MKYLAGNPVAEEIYTSIRSHTTQPSRHLAIILIGHDVASEVYINKKSEAISSCGGQTSVYKLPQDSSQIKVQKLIQELNHNSEIHGIIVQLPVPSHLNMYNLLSSIDPMKDVDGLNPLNLGMLVSNEKEARFIPATPLAVLAILKYYDLSVARKHIVIINNSILVGKPLLHLLTQQKATVTLCHRHTQNIKHYTRGADIIISAVGQPGIFDTSYLGKGQAIIDVGISKNSQGSIQGDFDSNQLVDKVAAYTPVPGGVGPVTVACLIQNLYKTLST